LRRVDSTEKSSETAKNKTENSETAKTKTVLQNMVVTKKCLLIAAAKTRNVCEIS